MPNIYPYKSYYILAHDLKKNGTVFVDDLSVHEEQLWALVAIHIADHALNEVRDPPLTKEAPIDGIGPIFDCASYPTRMLQNDVNFHRKISFVDLIGMHSGKHKQCEE